MVGRPGHKPEWPRSSAGLTSHPTAPGVQVTRSLRAMSSRPVSFLSHQELKGSLSLEEPAGVQVYKSTLCTRSRRTPLSIEHWSEVKATLPREKRESVWSLQFPMVAK